MKNYRLTRAIRELLSISLRTVLAVGVVVLIWAVAFSIVRQADVARMTTTDLATLLFGAASLALFMISLIFAIVATFGGQTLVSTARAIATEAVNSSNEPLRNELVGRMLSFEGHVLGELSLDPETLNSTNKEMLEKAITLCQEGYSLLKKVGGAAEFMALNNLVFYSMAARERVRGDFLLRGARILLDAGQEHSSIMLQLTGCGAILQYSTDREERRKAYEVLAEITHDKNASDREKREAKIYIKSTPEP